MGRQSTLPRLLLIIRRVEELIHCVYEFSINFAPVTANYDLIDHKIQLHGISRLRAILCCLMIVSIDEKGKLDPSDHSLCP